MSSVAKTKVQSELAQIIREATEKAAGADGRVSKKDEAQLPAYLQKVAADIRAKKGPGARLQADELIDSAISRAMSSWSKVNTKGPSSLSADEISKLKPELQELSKKAYDAAIDSKKPPVAPTSLKLSELPESSKLAVVIEERGTEWGDANITNGGTTRIFGGKLELGGAKLTSEQLGAFVNQHFLTKLTEDENTPVAGAKIKIETGKLGKSVVDQTAKFAMDGYAYSPENTESLTQLKHDIKEVSGAVGKSADVLFASASVKVTGSFTDTDQNARLTVFADRNTGRMAAFYVVEGFM